MTISSEHPFADPEPARDVVRRFRGRLGGTVSLWTTGIGAGRVGLTVSSLMVAQGEPGHLLGLVQPDSDLADALVVGKGVVVQLLEWPDRLVADAFAGQVPAPGGPFRFGEWEDTDWGPRLRSGSAWLGGRVETVTPVGFSVLVVAAVERAEIRDSTQPLVHRHGRYQRPPDNLPA